MFPYKNLRTTVFALIKKGIARKFKQQKATAGIRGIEWRLTFYQWWNAWQQSGYWDNRGKGSGYCMARKGDSGPYSVENIYFCTIGQNVKDSYVNKPPHVRRKRPD